MANDSKSTGILLESGTNEVEFLEFGIDDQNYGINVSKIRQVIVFEPEKVVTLPNSPECVVGSLCFRGNPIPVIDIRLYFKFKKAEDSRRLLLVTEFNQFVVAFVVDSVRNIRRCSWKDFRQNAHGAFGNGDDSIVGTIVENETMMPILDVEAILAALIPSASISSQADRDHGRPSIQRANAKIVYCEDSKVVQKVLLKSLQDGGFSDVQIFSTGTAGLEYLKTKQPSDVDIIISDIEMPQMDGLTFCKTLRQQSQFSKVPFLFFSSTVTGEMKKKCDVVGGNGAFSKPEIGQLMLEIDQQLKNKA